MPNANPTKNDEAGRHHTPGSVASQPHTTDRIVPASPTGESSADRSRFQAFNLSQKARNLPALEIRVRFPGSFPGLLFQPPQSFTFSVFTFLEVTAEISKPPYLAQTHPGQARCTQNDELDIAIAKRIDLANGMAIR